MTDYKKGRGDSTLWLQYDFRMYMIEDENSIHFIHNEKFNISKYKITEFLQRVTT